MCSETLVETRIWVGRTIEVERKKEILPPSFQIARDGCKPTNVDKQTILKCKILESKIYTFLNCMTRFISVVVAF